jgi:hypothetical protein
MGVDKGSNTDSTAEVLYKVVYTYLPNNTDWGVTEYEYDTNKRLVYSHGTFKPRVTDSTFGNIENFSVRYFRDVIGRVIKIERTGYLVDKTIPINIIVNYENATSRKITNMYSLVNYGSGAVVMDSTILFYDTANHLSKQVVYNTVPISGGGPLYLGLTVLNKYDNKENMIQSQEFQSNGNGGLVASISYSFEYDNKTNPFYSLDIPFERYNYFSQWSPNNIIKQINHYPPFNPPLIDDSIEYFYQYDIFARPVSISNSVYYPGKDVIKYYYRKP